MRAWFKHIFIAHTWGTTIQLYEPPLVGLFAVPAMWQFAACPCLIQDKVSTTIALTEPIAVALCRHSAGRAYKLSYKSDVGYKVDKMTIHLC